MTHSQTELQLKAADNYIHLFEHLSDQTIDQCASYVDEAMVFEDPFNRIEGRAAFQGLLKHGLSVMTGPKFHVTNRAWDGDILFVRWDFSASLPVIGAWSFTGTSALTISKEGMVRDHIDYWDSGRFFYALFPILGPIIRVLRKKAAYNHKA